MTDAEQQRIANIEHESHMKGFEVGRDIGRKEATAQLIALAEEPKGRIEYQIEKSTGKTQYHDGWRDGLKVSLAFLQDFITKATEK